MRYRGMRLIRVFAVVAMVLALIAIMMPKVASRGDVKKAQCAANLAGIGKGLAVYAAANGDELPQVAGWSAAEWLCDQPRGAYGMMVEAVQGSAGPAGKRSAERLFFCPKNNDQNMPAMLTGGGSYVVTGYVWFKDRGVEGDGTATLRADRNDAPTVEHEEQFKKGAMGARQEMIADWIVSDTVATTKRWTGMTFTGRPGVYSTSHMAPSKPEGANVLCFDGHVEWRPFDERKAAALPQGKGGVVFWVPAP